MDLISILISSFCAPLTLVRFFFTFRIAGLSLHAHEGHFLTFFPSSWYLSLSKLAAVKQILLTDILQEMQLHFVDRSLPKEQLGFQWLESIVIKNHTK